MTDIRFTFCRVDAPDGMVALWVEDLAGNHEFTEYLPNPCSQLELMRVLGNVAEAVERLRRLDEVGG